MNSEGLERMGAFQGDVRRVPHGSFRARVGILKRSLSLSKELASIKGEKMPRMGVYGLLLDVHLPPRTPLCLL